MSLIQNVPLFTIVLSLLCAVVSFVGGRKVSRCASIALLSLSTLAQGSLMIYCYVNRLSYTFMMGHYPAPWGNELAIGVTESSMAFLFALVMLLSVLGGISYVNRDVLAEKQELYGAMLCLTHAALMALAYTNDIFTGYVFIEILTIASCALLIAREGGRNLIAAIRYMVFALMGSGLFLIGVILLYSITGHLLFPQLRETVAALWESGGYRMSLTTAIGLIVAGLAIKSGLFPFHFWMPDTYGRATPTSSAILSGTASKGYIFLLIKIIYRVIGIEVFAESGVQTVLLLFGVAGMVIGSVSAIFSDRLTTMVSYSSAAQIGYIFMGLGMGTQAALVAVIFQILTHALTKPLLFLASRDLMEASGGRQDFKALRGAGHRSMAAGFAFTVGSLSMVGVPLLAGFIPKLYFATSALGLGYKTWVVWLALAVSTVLNVLYFLYTVILIWLPSEETYAPHPRRWSHALPMLVFTALNVAVGIFPGAIASVINQGFSLFCK